MNYSHPLINASRNLLRRFRLTQPLGNAIRWLRPRGYEEQFEEAILQKLRPGFIVWDVGANVGYFTTQFANAVGPAGKVVAFEPARSSFGILQEAIAAHANIVAERMALGDSDSVASFAESSKPGDPTNHLVPSQTGTGEQVPVLRGDSYVAAHPELAPMMLKVDVEGFELEVLRGCQKILVDRRTQGVFVEVHFTQLQSRNLPEAPSEIVRVLSGHGFHVRWVDPSHIAATR